jgi:hypothetical protein
MSTQARLEAYEAAELKILRGQSVRFGERQLQMADLAEVRKAISDLNAKLARERLAAQGASSLSYSVADFTGAGR